MNYLKRFIFNICPENSNAYGYVTEKLFHAISVGCVPIYWGGYNRPEPDVLNKDAILFWDNNSEKLHKEVEALMSSPKLLIEFLKQPRLLPTAEEYILDSMNDIEKKIREAISKV